MNEIKAITKRSQPFYPLAAEWNLLTIKAMGIYALSPKTAPQGHLTTALDTTILLQVDGSSKKGSGKLEG